MWIAPSTPDETLVIRARDQAKIRKKMNRAQPVKEYTFPESDSELGFSGFHT
jgi:hypothetical protein